MDDPDSERGEQPVDGGVSQIAAPWPGRMHRVAKMAKVLGLDFVPLLLPKDRTLRKKKLQALIKEFI